MQMILILGQVWETEVYRKMKKVLSSLSGWLVIEGNSKLVSICKAELVPQIKEAELFIAS